MQGFYTIPFYSNYQINSTGVVYSSLSNSFLEGSINPAGYHNYRVKGDDGLIKTMGGHRLVAMTFHGVPDNYENLDVNHLNGIKWDNRATNVEWATRQENVHHAGWNGLTEKCVPIEVRDTQSGEVFQYPSYISAAMDLGLSKDAIARRIGVGEHYVDEIFNQYRKFTGNPEWMTPTAWADNPVLVREATSGLVADYPTQLAIAEAYGVSPAMISNACNNPNQPLIRMGNSLYQLRLMHPFCDWIVRENPYLDYENNTNCRFIVMYNPYTEFPRIFFTLSEAAEAYGVKKNVPYQRARANKLEPWHDGLICHYLFNR